ncbi:ABC transporter substrate-binding protein [Nocardioides euryhalodurans]|uniref:Amino acid ABC transporter substrate-binding protein n=1 Tax=Nocardioides euryhalodurans TaxID=2518370 RepID=A0A4V1BDF0_9ACTN|nr:ABC transporter substrate-binding protein [Nocardioides euryhalodurans]QBR90892.1 amino acid ABC transporter substrate-binding protein [Nocardioides euryhalodurans]
MIRTSRARRLGVALAASAIVLSACGGSDEPDEAADPNTSEETESEAAPTGDGTLTLGSLLPQTGDLAFLGPPEFAGVNLAVEDMNAAGGVLGQDVVNIEADSGDGTPDIAGAEVDKLFNQDVDAIIGAAASGVSVSVIDKITGNGTVHFSPANTAAGFDTYDDNGLYFRTAPSDRLQGQVLANLAVEDGFSNVAVMARQDFYGEGLAEQVQTTLEEKGATVAEYVLYAADAQNYTAEVNKIAAAKPDALVLVAFEETTKIIPQLIAKGIGPQDIQIYFVDGNLADYSAENFDLTGVKGTLPVSGDPDPGFNDRLLEIDPKLKDFSYGPQSYDAAMIIGLAAIAAGDDSGEAIGAEIINVTREGTQCSTFEECAQLLEDGEDIDYEGASGPTDMNDSGSPASGTIGINEYSKGNTYEQVDTVSGLVE